MTYPYKGLKSKLYKELIQLNNNNNNKNNLIKKWAEEPNRNFSKEYIQTVNRHIKRGDTTLIIRKMQIKTTMKYHLISVSIGMIKKTRYNECW